MSKGAKISIIVLCLVFAGFLIWSLNQKNDKDNPSGEIEPYKLVTADLSNYPSAYQKEDGTYAVSKKNSHVELIVDADLTGGFEEHIRGGDVATADVVLYEIADYQCSGCATVTPWMNEVVDEYKGKVAVVYRGYLLDYHPNARSSAAAANAAGLQGYWEEYADFLFAHQSDWGRLTGDTRTSYFVAVMNEVSGGKADLAKFRSDMASEKNTKKIDYDYSIGNAVHLNSTPSFYYDGKEINWYDDSTTKEDFYKFWRNYFDNIIKERSKETEKA